MFIRRPIGTSAAVVTRLRDVATVARERRIASADFRANGQHNSAGLKCDFKAAPDVRRKHSAPASQLTSLPGVALAALIKRLGSGGYCDEHRKKGPLASTARGAVATDDDDGADEGFEVFK